MDYRQESRYVETETAPVLETPERAGSGMILELVTAGRSRHAELDSSHNARSRRKVQALDTSIAINFLRQPGAGCARSNWSEKGMVERKAISKRERFEILKRDGFKCRYCGRTPPEVTLEIDHLKPVAGGGCNCQTNLVTACFDCNRGKGVSVFGHRERPDVTELYKKASEAQRAARMFYSDQEMLIDDYVLINLLLGIKLESILVDMARCGTSEDGKADFIWNLRYRVDEYVWRMECGA